MLAKCQWAYIMVKLVLLPFVCFGYATSISKETCPEDSVPISDACWVLGTLVAVPYEVAKMLCKEDGGLITVQANPVEIGEYLAKELPDKSFWAGKMSSDTCLSFSGSKKGYIQEDCGARRYYICHVEKVIQNIKDQDELPQEGFQKAMFLDEDRMRIEDLFTNDNETVEYDTAEAFEKRLITIEEFFQNDNETIADDIEEAFENYNETVTESPDNTTHKVRSHEIILPFSHIGETLNDLITYGEEGLRNQTTVVDRYNQREGYGYEVSKAVEKVLEVLKNVFTYDEEALKNETNEEGCLAMIYVGVLHTGCTKRGSFDGTPWCGTDGGVFWPGISNWKWCFDKEITLN